MTIELKKFKNEAKRLLSLARTWSKVTPVQFFFYLDQMGIIQTTVHDQTQWASVWMPGSTGLAEPVVVDLRSIELIVDLDSAVNTGNILLEKKEHRNKLRMVAEDAKADVTAPVVRLLKPAEKQSIALSINQESIPIPAVVAARIVATHRRMAKQRTFGTEHNERMFCLRVAKERVYLEATNSAALVRWSNALPGKEDDAFVLDVDELYGVERFLAKRDSEWYIKEVTGGILVESGRGKVKLLPPRWSVSAFPTFEQAISPVEHLPIALELELCSLINALKAVTKRRKKDEVVVKFDLGKISDAKDVSWTSKQRICTQVLSWDETQSCYKIEHTVGVGEGRLSIRKDEVPASRDEYIPAPYLSASELLALLTEFKDEVVVMRWEASRSANTNKLEVVRPVHVEVTGKWEWLLLQMPIRVPNKKMN